MTKADLIDLIAERAKLPHGRAELLISQMFDSMVDALCRGEGIEIRGFGSFSIRAYKEYQGRNPRTGEAVRVRPKRLAFFKVGKELRERVNISRATNGAGSNGTYDDDDDADADSDAD
jgi:integration host factor subunit beta